MADPGRAAGGGTGGEPREEAAHSTLIRVTNLPDVVDEDYLEMFFESKKLGGCTVAGVELDSDKGEAIVEFEDLEAAEIVLQKQPVNCKGKLLHIELFVPESPTENTSEEEPEEELPIKILVSNIPPSKADEDYLSMFFENTKKYGGGPVANVEINKKEGVAIIEFAEPGAVQIVLEKQSNQLILLAKTEIRVEVYVQEKLQDEAKDLIGGEGDTVKIVVTNIPDKAMDEEYLEMFFERNGDNVASVELLKEYASAVIQFEEPRGVEHILSKQPIKMYKAEVVVKPFNPAYAPRDVVVVRGEGLEPDLLDMYFTSQKRSNGGSLEKLDLDDDGEVAYLTFENETVARRVVDKEKHSIGKQQLSVSLFQPADPLLVFLKQRSGSTDVTQYQSDGSEGKQKVTKGKKSDTEPEQTSCRTVKVQGIKNVKTKETVQNYFENRCRSGGGEIAEMKSDEEDDNVAFIIFHCTEDAKEVSERATHYVDDCELSVSLYISSSPLPSYAEKHVIKGITRTSSKYQYLENKPEAVKPKSLNKSKKANTQLATLKSPKEVESLIHDVDQQKLQHLSQIGIKIDGNPTWINTSEMFDLYTFYYAWVTLNDWFVKELTKYGIHITTNDSNGIELQVTDECEQNTSNTKARVKEIILTRVLNNFGCKVFKEDTKSAVILQKLLDDDPPLLAQCEDVLVLSDTRNKCLCIVGAKTRCQEAVEDVRRRVDAESASEEVESLIHDVDQQKLHHLSQIAIRIDGNPTWINTSEMFDLYTFYYVWITLHDYFVEKLKECGIQVSCDSAGIELKLTGESDINASNTKAFVNEIISNKVLNEYDCRVFKDDSKSAVILRNLLDEELPVPVQCEDVLVLSDRKNKCLCIVGNKMGCEEVAEDIRRREDTACIAEEDIPVQIGWGHDSFIVKLDGSHTLELQNEIDYSILQFCLTSDIHKKRALVIFKRKNVDVQIQSKSCIFVDCGKVTNDARAFQNILSDAVRSCLTPGLMWYIIQDESEEKVKLLNFLKTCTPPDVKHGFVSVFQYPIYMCIIGRETKCNQFLIDVDLPPPLEMTEHTMQIEAASSTPTTRKASNGTKQSEEETTELNIKQPFTNNLVQHHSLEQRNTRATETHSVETLNCTTEEFQLLNDLKFLDYFHGTDISKLVTISMGKYPGLIKGEMSTIRLVHNTIIQFLQSVHTQLIFESREYRILLQNDDGGNNIAVFQFLETRLCRAFGNSYSNISFNCSLRLKAEGLEVSCRDEDVCSKVASVLSKCIRIYECSSKTKPLLEKELDKRQWKDKIKVYSVNETCKYICTSDVLQEVLGLLGDCNEVQTKVIALPELLIDFLGGYGHYMLRAMSEQINVEVELIEGMGLRINGTDKDVQKCKAYLKKTVPGHQRSILVSMPEEEIKVSKQAIDDTAVQRHFYWKLKDLLDMPSKQMQSCTHIAKWFDPNGSLQLTVITGILEDIDVDAMILITNDSLYPLDTPPGNNTPNFVQRGGHDFTQAVKNIFSQPRTLRVGDIFTYPCTPGTIHAKEVYCIVAQSAIKEDKLSSEQLKTKLKDTLALIYLNSKRCSSVGIHASKLHQCLELEEVLNATLKGGQMFFMERPGTQIEMFLCCFDEDVADVASTVNKYFETQGGFGTRVYSDTTFYFEHRKATVKMLVEVDSILQSKVDVIVNTVGKNLDLSKGQVSAQILDKAGQKIQQECDQRKPHGIPDGGLVVTEAYNIQGKKHVIHGAIAVYHKDTFQNHIKEFVKKCMYATERLDDCSSIAFPALGVGNLMYPRRDVACAMFDAIEEFCTEALNPKLKKVAIVLYSKDEKTCHAFCEEELRRKEKKDHPIVYVSDNDAKRLKRITHSATDVTTVLVTLVDAIRMPSHTVEVFFKLKNTQVQPELKQASRNPKTWHDQLYVSIPTSEKIGLTAGVKICLHYCLKDRTTAIIIYTCKELDIPEGEQVRIIADTVAAVQNQKYLRTVYILVDEAAYANVHAKGIRDTWQEERIDVANEYKCAIEILGERDSLDDAVKAVRDVLSGIEINQTPTKETSIHPNNAVTQSQGNYDAQGARPKVPNPPTTQVSSNTGKPLHPPPLKPQQPRTDTATDMESDDKSMNNEKIIKDSVSATGNPGKESFLESSSHQETDETEEIQSIQSDNTPDTHDASILNETVKHEAKTDTPMVFKVNSVIVKVVKGDIVDQLVDCIAISNQRNMIREAGAAHHIAKVAGENYERECRLSAKQLGDLSVGECRLTSSGNLKCHRVAHVYVYKDSIEATRNTNCEMLLDLEQAIYNCCVKVNKEKGTSLALTCIGAGTSKLSVTTCAQQYIRALLKFKQATHLKEVTFVDTKAENVRAVRSQFEQHFERYMPEEDVEEGDCSWQLVCKDKTVRVDVVIGDVSTSYIDAVVSIEDMVFSGKGIHAQRLLKAGGDRYRSKHADLKSKRIKRLQVENTYILSGLLCKYVFHAVLPDDVSPSDVKDATIEVLKSVGRLHVESIAIPILHNGTSTEKIEACGMMMNGMENYFHCHSSSSIKRIEVLCLDSREMKTCITAIQTRGSLLKRSADMGTQV